MYVASELEYDTLHVLMIRDTPGRASPGDLAALNRLLKKLTLRVEAG